MSSLLTMIGAAGGSTGAYYFLGCASGASTNNQSQNVFKFSPTEYKGASNWYDSDGNMYFGYFALKNDGYEGFGIAKFEASDGSPVGSMVALPDATNGNEGSLYQGPTNIQIDNSTNLVFLIRGDFSGNYRNAIMKLGDSSDGTNPSNWSSTDSKSRYYGSSSYTENTYSICKNKESGSDHFYGVGHTQRPGRNNQFNIKKFDMNNPTGNPSITWAKYFDTGGSTCDFTDCDSDTSGNLYAIGGQAHTPLIAKFDSSGTPQWYTQITGDSTNAYGRSVVCSDDGSDLYFTFKCQGFGSQSTSYQKVGISKVNSSTGALTWSRIITKQNANEHMEGNCLTIDSSGNWYMIMEGQSVDSSLSQGIISGDSSGNYRWVTAMKANPLAFGQNDLTYDDRGSKQWLVCSPDDKSLYFSTTSSSNKNSINYRGMGQVPSDGSGGDNSDFVINSGNLNFTGVRYADLTSSLGLETVTLSVTTGTGSCSDNAPTDSTSYGNQTSSRWLTTTAGDKIKNTFGDPYTGNFT